jgi:tetratricopeptide (TPR) repeat protein
VIIPDTADLLDRGSQRQAAGEWSAALALYEEAYRHAGAQVDLDTLLEAATRIGHCLRESGDVEAAHDAFGFVATVAGLAGDHARAARALNGIAILHQASGEIAHAERVYLQAREHALQIQAEYVLGEIEQNLGILDNIRGDLEAALEHYQAGLRHLRLTGHLRGAARALNNLGMLHIDMGRLSESDAYFQQALELCEQAGDVVTTCYIHINRAELYLALGQSAPARAATRGSRSPAGCTTTRGGPRR